MDNRMHNNNQPNNRSRDGFDVNKAVQYIAAIVHHKISKAAMWSILREKMEFVKDIFRNTRGRFCL